MLNYLPRLTLNHSNPPNLCLPVARITGMSLGAWPELMSILCANCSLVRSQEIPGVLNVSVI
jgi:hypothetical protein